jgi:Rieske Fe-S protein
MTTSGPCCSRRTLLGAAGALGAVGLLSACGVEGDPTNVQSSSAPDEPVITDLATLEEEGAVAFETTEGKAIVVMVGDEVVAFSSVCTHQGCTVAYDAEEQVLACPCHGSKFDPADGAKVVAGPAEAPLPTVEVVVDEAAGVVRRA